MLNASLKNGLLALADKSARLVGQNIGGARRDTLERALAGMDEQQGPLPLFAELWAAAGLSGQPLPLASPTPAQLPFVLFTVEHGWCVVQARGADGLWRAENADGGAVLVADLRHAVCVALPQRARGAGQESRRAPGALALVGAALLARKNVFIDAIVATALVTILTMAASLFSMQVYDRVIPNQSFNTLWVLGVGVSLSIVLEFFLKQVRARTVDRSCNAIDHELSEWFFQRMLGIRMDVRPASVGTLASQVKGFEMVRGVLASTSVFALTDVPFALLFMVMIASVGGWLVLVPLATMPLALLAGLMFQRAIQRNTSQNLQASNRKAGLLVESVDGIESLKSNSAEWGLLARWSALVEETGTAEQQVRNYAALSQNLTVTLQQLSYIALVAAGAYMVAENQLSMGALMACSIVSNRALAPIVQLPGVMVQWAHARAAIEGLDKIIMLDNEADTAHCALAPQGLDGGLRFERTRFSYGAAQQTALEIERLDIKPGEKVGLIGAIGSGKSTLLKLSSGLYRPAEGKVFLGGVDMALLAPAVARELVGYLPQEARLFSGTLHANLIMGLPDPGEDAILAAARRTGLIELIVGQPRGLELEISEGGRGVSGGQRQLIAVTRMLLARPRVWLLDEPTGAMDAKSEARMVALLGELAAEGVTLIATTHKNALLPLLDRLVVLQGGRVVVDGPRDAVLAKLSGKTKAVIQEAAA